MGMKRALNKDTEKIKLSLFHRPTAPRTFFAKVSSHNSPHKKPYISFSPLSPDAGEGKRNDRCEATL